MDHKCLITYITWNILAYEINLALKLTDDILQKTLLHAVTLVQNHIQPSVEIVLVLYDFTDYKKT